MCVGATQNCWSRQRRQVNGGEDYPQTVGMVTGGPKKVSPNGRIARWFVFLKKSFWLHHFVVCIAWLTRRCLDVSSTNEHLMILLLLSCLFDQKGLGVRWMTSEIPIVFLFFVSRNGSLFSRCWFQILFNFHPELWGRFPFWLILGGFKDFLFSPRTLGRWSNLTSIFFRWVGSTTN